MVIKQEVSLKDQIINMANHFEFETTFEEIGKDLKVLIDDSALTFWLLRFKGGSFELFNENKTKHLSLPELYDLLFGLHEKLKKS